MTNPKKLNFDFNWKLTVFVILMLPMLLRLGFWQLERAEEKTFIQEKWLTEQTKPPVAITHLDDKLSTEQSYRRVTVKGSFITEKYWLQENQVRNGKLGYQVIMLLKTENDQLLAVDRGWVEGSPMRDFIPTFPTPEKTVSVTGALVTPSDSKLVREAEVSAKTWPHKILEIDLKVIAHQYEANVFSKLMRLDADSQGALDVNWKPINMSAAKHIGYAVQWFCLAFALVVLFVFASTNLSEWFKKE